MDIIKSDRRNSGNVTDDSIKLVDRRNDVRTGIVRADHLELDDGHYGL